MRREQLLKMIEWEARNEEASRRRRLESVKNGTAVSYDELHTLWLKSRYRLGKLRELLDLLDDLDLYDE